jgi:hypothetical protein
MPYTVSAEGNILYNWLVMIVITPASVAANITAEQSFTVPGLVLGDYVGVYANAAQTAGIGIVNNRVSAMNTLQIGFSNSTSGALTPVAGQYYLQVARPESFQNLPGTASS